MVDIAIIGEAWGEAEARLRTPFVGGMSRELTPMLEEAGIHRADCFLTNVFNIRYDGKPEIFCGPKAEGLDGYGPMVASKYCREEFRPELDRLAAELIETNPNVIIPMGNTPLWALTGRTGISKQRGTTSLSTHTVSGFKILPTYHPAAIIHQWDLRPVTVLDLMKAARESKFPEIRRPRVDVYVPETVEDILEFETKHIQDFLSVDIETAGDQITCIGFAPSSQVSITIPFYDFRRSGRSYWRDNTSESDVWGIVKRILGDGNIRKLFQNGLYDISFLWRAYGIRVMGASEDTMLLHHALQPEALKGLGFLGSVYTDHGAWKQMRGKIATIKGDE